MSRVVDFGCAQMPKLVHRRAIYESPGDQGPNPVRRQMSTRLVRKEVPGRGCAQHIRQLVRQRQHAVLCALPMNDERPSNEVVDEVVLGAHLRDFPTAHA